MLVLLDSRYRSWKVIEPLEAERGWGGARGGERIVIELLTSDRELKASREGSKCKDVRCPTCPETWLKLRAGACFAQLLLKL